VELDGIFDIPDGAGKEDMDFEGPLGFKGGENVRRLGSGLEIKGSARKPP